jgi:lipopolysaccharide/colanic/teichoic acid biosynthesis glycosyltransferase
MSQKNMQLAPIQSVLDRFCVAVGLVLFSPLLAAIALTIKLDDGGPVFFTQQRVGKNFKTFRLLKFRSMIVGGDRQGSLTTANDPRVTRVGRFLRKFKLDELPQLINVLKGEMRLVGTRPELECYVAMFPNEYSLLLQDCPGITDPASLVYRHEEQMLLPETVEEQYTSQILPAKLKLSLEYRRGRNIISDVGVLLRTMVRLTT